MKPIDIRELIAKGRTEQAIQASRELTKNTELEDVGVGIAKSQRDFKRKSMMGILSTAEERQEEAIIANRILQLLNEYIAITAILIDPFQVGRRGIENHGAAIARKTRVVAVTIGGSADGVHADANGTGCGGFEVDDEDVAVPLVIVGHHLCVVRGKCDHASVAGQSR